MIPRSWGRSHPRLQAPARKGAATDKDIRVPPHYPSSIVYIDESGTVTNDRFFVVGGLKVRRHGDLSRAIRAVRTRHDFWDEFRFNRVSRAKLPAYLDLIDQLSSPDLAFAACVVDKEIFDPGTLWSGATRHVQVIAQLLVGCINRREVVSVLLDAVSSASDEEPVEDHVRRLVNTRLGNLSVVTAACLDSRASDGLQLADVICGAIAFERRRENGQSGNPNSHKAKVVERLKAVLNVQRLDGRTPRLNVATYRGPRRQSRPTHLQAVRTTYPDPRRASGTEAV